MLSKKQLYKQTKQTIQCIKLQTSLHPYLILIISLPLYLLSLCSVTHSLWFFQDEALFPTPFLTLYQGANPSNLLSSGMWPLQTAGRHRPEYAVTDLFERSSYYSWWWAQYNQESYNGKEVGKSEMKM